MSAPNHIIGGVVFTGIFCSFWNINIFSSPWYLAITIFSSLLPDIDHTRSTIGKIFLPIAKYLDRNFGHRTITHSIIFVMVTYLIVYLFSAFTFLDMNIPLIFIFAIISHLIFDMLTVQGVPLFYPFKRNPCVIPGNPEHRLQGNASSEFVVFGIFSLLVFFCIPLFKNGFWMSYNTNFNTLMHVNRVYASSETMLKVRYDYTENSNQIKGEGLLLYSEEGKAFIFDSTTVLKMTTKAIIKELQPTKTNLKKEYITIHFQNITIDSLNKLLSNHIISSGEITGNHPFNITIDNQVETTSHLKLEWSYNDQITQFESPELSKINHKKFELANAIEKFKIDEVQYNKLLQQKDSISRRIVTSNSDYDREHLLAKLKELDSKIEKTKPNDSKITDLRKEINYLLANLIPELNFTGFSIKISIN